MKLKKINSFRNKKKIEKEMKNKELTNTCFRLNKMNLKTIMEKKS
jgi:hypothetical protein